MRFSKWTAYIIGLLIIRTPFIFYKIIWLSKTRTVKACVVSVNRTKHLRYEQEYPVYEYTVGEYRYRKSGNYNMPFKAGDSVFLRYKVSNPLTARLDTLWGLWIDTFLYSGVLVLIWSMIFLHRKIIPEGSDILITHKGIKLTAYRQLQPTGAL